MKTIHSCVRRKKYLIKWKKIVRVSEKKSQIIFTREEVSSQRLHCNFVSNVLRPWSPRLGPSKFVKEVIFNK